MWNFFDSVHACVLGHPLRFLLCTTGSAVATATIYYFVCKDRKKTDADPEKYAAEDSGSPSELPQDQPTVPAAPCPTAEISKDEAELKDQEVQLEIKNLKEHVEKLTDRIQDMQSLMFETQNKHCQERENVCKAHKALQLEHEEITKKIQHLYECEREQVAYLNLTMKYNNTKVFLTDINTLITSNFNQMLDKRQKAVEYFINLHFEKSNLIKDMEILKGTVQDMGNLISETQNEHGKVYDKEVQACELMYIAQQQIADSFNHFNNLLTTFKTSQKNLFDRVARLEQAGKLMDLYLHF